MEGTEIILKSENPVDQMRWATDVAGACGEIVKRTVVNIQGKKYVPVEGWQAIANAHGCCASSGSVEKVEGGYRAIGQIRRRSDGVIIAEAEGFVGDDEKQWASKPEYAKRGMVQTRAISRAGRSAFAHVIVLIDKDLSTTPAEEVPTEGFKTVDYVDRIPHKETPIGYEATKEHRDMYWSSGGKKTFKDTFNVELYKQDGKYVYAPLGTYDIVKNGGTPKIERKDSEDIPF